GRILRRCRHLRSGLLRPAAPSALPPAPPLPASFLPQAATFLPSAPVLSRDRTQIGPPRPGRALREKGRPAGRALRSLPRLSRAASIKPCPSGEVCAAAC